MFKKLCDNLDLLMSEARLNAEELSRRTGLPASTIKKIRNRDNLNPTLSTLTPLAKYFALTISQLVGDEPLPKNRVKGLYQENPATFCYVPLLAWEEAIAWPNVKEQQYDNIPTEYQYSENAYALSVYEGNWENLAKGTILLVDPLIKPEHRDFVIVYKEGQKIPTLKQLLCDEEQIYLKPVISGYNIVPLTPQHKLLGVVVEYKKHLKLPNKTVEVESNK